MTLLTYFDLRCLQLDVLHRSMQIRREYLNETIGIFSIFDKKSQIAFLFSPFHTVFPFDASVCGCRWSSGFKMFGLGSLRGVVLDSNPGIVIIIIMIRI